MTDTKAVVLSSEKKDHRFKKGQSGNPAGRPKGIKNAITQYKLLLESELRAQMKPEMGEVLKKGLELAKAGNPDMIKFFLDKWITPAKASADDEAPREKVQILIGRLGSDPEPPIQGRIIEHEGTDNG